MSIDVFYVILNEIRIRTTTKTVNSVSPLFLCAGEVVYGLHLTSVSRRYSKDEWVIRGPNHRFNREFVEFVFDRGKSGTNGFTDEPVTEC